MRTARGLQITSIVVLSPVLLILISLISMLLCTIYSQIHSLIFIYNTTSAIATTAAAAAAAVTTNSLTQPPSAEVSTLLVIPQQRSFTNNQNKSQVSLLKRFRSFFRSRPMSVTSPMTWCIPVLFYAIYYIFIKKKVEEKETQQQQQNIGIEPILESEKMTNNSNNSNKKQHSKRRKIAGKKSNNFKKRSRSTSTSSTEEQQQHNVNVNSNKLKTSLPSPSQQQQSKEEVTEDNNEKEWTSVICEKSKNKRKVNSSTVTQDQNNEHMKMMTKNKKSVNNTPLSPTTTKTTANATIMSGGFPSPTFSCTTPPSRNNSNYKKVTTTIDLNLISPESTPIHSEDEDEAVVFENTSTTTKNWYSPFNTGLDLDIIPKYSHHEQDVIFKNIYTMNHFKSNIHHPQQQLTSIQLLENHPFIPSTTTSTSSVYTSHPHHAFGSIGDKRKHLPTV